MIEQYMENNLIKKRLRKKLKRIKKYDQKD